MNNSTASLSLKTTTPQHEMFLSPLHASNAAKESTPKNQETPLSILPNYQLTTLNLSKTPEGWNQFETNFNYPIKFLINSLCKKLRTNQSNIYKIL